MQYFYYLTLKHPRYSQNHRPEARFRDLKLLKAKRKSKTNNTSISGFRPDIHCSTTSFKQETNCKQPYGYQRIGKITTLSIANLYFDID